MFVKSVLVLDFGSQYTRLIVRRLRDKGYYAVLLPHSVSEDVAREYDPGAVILSGGPNSVYEEGAPQMPEWVLSLSVPVLGICYGLQLIAHTLGGQVQKAPHREYGRARLHVDNDRLFEGLPREFDVWMSHGDRVERLPEGFFSIAHTSDAPYAAIRNTEGTMYGVQFHPEVAHTQYGSEILADFVSNVAGLQPTWKVDNLVDVLIDEVRQQVGDGKVILGLSGGVDSSTLALLLHKAIGDRVIPIFVDTGLMRKNESAEVRSAFENLGIHIHMVDASEEFFRALKGVTDPEEKRKRIGHTFIDVFTREAERLKKEHGDIEFLAQGTLYPDVIESSVHGGPSRTIKTHHNVGGLPEKLGFKLVEPFRYLFKDEVREIARALGLPEYLVKRHPFPGPGLAVRILGEVTPERVKLLQEADAIFIEELKRWNLYDSVWQAFAVLLPVQSVGVMGDERTYENAVVLRAVVSTDGMTADWARLPYDFLDHVSRRIVGEVRGINRVAYDITSKPPGTIEWE